MSLILFNKFNDTVPLGDTINSPKTLEYWAFQAHIFCSIYKMALSCGMCRAMPMADTDTGEPSQKNTGNSIAKRCLYT